MIVQGQLANPVKKADKYIGDNYWWEQKLDGVRLLVHIMDGQIYGVNRKGDITHLDPFVRAGFEHFLEFDADLVFDGEYVNGEFWVFDLPYPNAGPYEERRRYLEMLLASSIIDPTVTGAKIQLLAAAKTPEEKLKLLKWCQENGSEGIMIKDINAGYSPGECTNDTLKFKFWKSCDVVVTEVWREGKHSIGAKVYDLDGSDVDVGSITTPERILNSLSVGDVVECKYLYATNDHKLYQASMPRKRTDKDAKECTIGQLEYFNKQVNDTLTKGTQ